MELISVVITTYKRKKTIVERAIKSVLGQTYTNIEIIDMPGYAPLINDENLINIAADAAKLAVPEYKFEIIDEVGSGSTDLGDLSCIMPAVHPYAIGATGTCHGDDYQIEDPNAACVGSAKLQLGMLYLLLADDAKNAKRIIDEYKPVFASKEEYLDFVDRLNCSGDRIDYSDENIISVKAQ